MADVRGVITTMPSYYESAIVLQLANDRKQLVIRQYRSPNGERFVNEGAAALKAFLEARQGWRMTCSISAHAQRR